MSIFQVNLPMEGDLELELEILLLESAAMCVCLQSWNRTNMLNKAKDKWMYWQHILTVVMHLSILQFVPFTAWPKN